MKKRVYSFSRRRFLEMLAAGGAGLTLGFPRWRAEAAHGPETPLRIAFYTDVHARTEWDTPEAMALAAAAINAQQPDIVIAGGDLITDGFNASAESVRTRWDAYMEMHRAIHGRVEAAIGNHDLVAARPADGSAPAEDPRSEFLDRMGLERTWRSFDFGGCHFVLLDSIHVTGDAFEYEGWVDAEQLAWLREDAAALALDTPVIVVTHIPLLTSFYQATEGATAAAPRNRVVANSREVLNVFDGCNLLAVLQGHLHVDELLRWRGITFVTGGAVCGKWWRGAWHGTPEGFGVLTVEKRHVGWQYFGFGWQARRPVGA
jgi:3',5'-cyclic AMP phosphodiesterase CpdA